MASITDLSLDAINNALDYCHETLVIERDWERDLDEIAALEAAHRQGEHRAPGTPGCSICDEILTTILETLQEETEADAEPDAVGGSEVDWPSILAEEDAKQKAWESTTVHEGFTISALRAAFSAVANPDGWKLPVSAAIKAEDRAITRAAVIFHTGSVPTFSQLPGGKLLCEASGYYIACGA